MFGYGCAVYVLVMPPLENKTSANRGFANESDDHRSAWCSFKNIRKVIWRDFQVFSKLWKLLISVTLISL